MTVKELKDRLDQFPDDLIVMIPNNDAAIHHWAVEATGVGRGCNEADGCVFIYASEEEEE